MECNVVKISQTSGNTVPFVSIGRGQLDFNAVSCDLVNDNGNYKYAQLLTAKDKGKTVVAVKFLENYENDTIVIKRKVQNGKTIKDMFNERIPLLEKYADIKINCNGNSFMKYQYLTLRKAEELINEEKHREN